ncbi:MAG: hypothetical protein WCI66_01175 [Gammaproteobacteria bacterium]
METDAKFVPVFTATGFCLGTGFAAIVVSGLALFAPVFAMGAAGFLTGLTIFLAAGLITTFLAAGFFTTFLAITFLAITFLVTTGLALDFAGAFLPLAALGLPELAGLLFLTDLTGVFTGFFSATLVLELVPDFPAEDFLALFVLAILGTLL